MLDHLNTVKESEFPTKYVQITQQSSIYEKTKIKLESLKFKLHQTLNQTIFRLSLEHEI